MNQRENARPPYRLINCLWLLICCALLSGCALTNETRRVFDMAKRTTHVEPHFYEYIRSDRVAQREARLLAEQAWAASNFHERSNDFQNGFLEGFADHLYRGGSGEPPVIPPRGYWNLRFLNQFGKSSVNDWYEGFREGAQDCKARGLRDMWLVPTSLIAEPEEPYSPPDNWADEDEWTNERNRRLQDDRNKLEPLRNPEEPPVPRIDMEDLESSTGSGRSDDDSSDAASEYDEDADSEDDMSTGFDSRLDPYGLEPSGENTTSGLEDDATTNGAGGRDPFSDEGPDSDEGQTEMRMRLEDEPDDVDGLPNLGAADTPTTDTMEPLGTGLPETGAPDTGIPDAELPDAELPDTDLFDGSLEPSSEPEFDPFSLKYVDPNRQTASKSKRSPRSGQRVRRDGDVRQATGTQPVNKLRRNTRSIQTDDSGSRMSLPQRSIDRNLRAQSSRTKRSIQKRANRSSAAKFSEELVISDSVPAIPLQVDAPRPTDFMEWDPMEGVDVPPEFEVVEFDDVMSDQVIDESTRWMPEMSRGVKLPSRLAPNGAARQVNSQQANSINVVERPKFDNGRSQVGLKDQLRMALRSPTTPKRRPAKTGSQQPQYREQPFREIEVADDGLPQIIDRNALPKAIKNNSNAIQFRIAD